MQISLFSMEFSVVRAMRYLSLGGGGISLVRVC